MNYHVKKSRRTRFTYRFVGISIFVLCGSQVVLFAMGYGQTHKIATFIAFAFALYGAYIFINSFRGSAYDIDYEFREKEFVVHTKYGDKTYTYEQITDLNQIIPENEFLYSIIQIYVGKKQYILPFSYKKEVADKIYAFLNERVTTRTILSENLEALIAESKKEQAEKKELEDKNKEVKE